MCCCDNDSVVDRIISVSTSVIFLLYPAVYTYGHPEGDNSASQSNMQLAE